VRSIQFSFLAALAAGVALTAGSAAAETVTAKLKTPLSAPRKSIAGGTVFECLGDVCAARAASSEAGGLRGCRDLVRQVGPLTSFGLDSKPLATDELAACNQAAK
jgi:curli biogenesis system outer membrane secretion channel CsgG